VRDFHDCYWVSIGARAWRRRDIGQRTKRPESDSNLHKDKWALEADLGRGVHGPEFYS